MSAFSADPHPHRIHTVHRVGAGLLGGFLTVFGLTGLTRAPGFMTAQGSDVFGLSTNGLLAGLSVLVGAVLIAAARRGGHVASTVSVVVGSLFLLSGLGNTLVLGTAMNMLAFRLSNVVFSLAVGAALLFLGAYGRFTGHLPATSPYAHGELERADARAERGDGAPDRELAEAERAVAQHAASPAQLAGVAAAATRRSHDDRRRAFVAAAADHGRSSS